MSEPVVSTPRRQHEPSQQSTDDSNGDGRCRGQGKRFHESFPLVLGHTVGFTRRLLCQTYYLDTSDG